MHMVLDCVLQTVVKEGMKHHLPMETTPYQSRTTDHSPKSFLEVSVNESGGHRVKRKVLRFVTQLFDPYSVMYRKSNEPAYSGELMSLSKYDLLCVPLQIQHRCLLVCL